MLATDFPRVLVALRTLALPFYVRLMQAHHDDRASYDRGMAAVGKLSAELGLPDLTALLASREYRDFLQRLNSTDPSVSADAQTILETKEYEQRLSRLKRESPSDYLDQLRVIGREELMGALVNGTIVNAISDDGSPMPVRSDERYSGAFLDRPTATAYLDAGLLVSVLVQVSSSGSDVVANPQGLRLRQVVIGGGELNLNWLDCPFPLGFEGCDFHHWLSAANLRVPWLSFESCDFTPWGQATARTGALNAEAVVVDHELRFWDCRGLDQLFLRDARIGSFTPRNPLATEDAGAAGWKPTPFRTVIDGAEFGRLTIPEERTEDFGFVVTRSIRVGELDGLVDPDPSLPAREQAEQVAEQVFTWLVESESSPSEDSGDGATFRHAQEVWDEIEEALRRSGHREAARRFGIAAARHQTFAEGFRGRVKRATLGPTVHYFYDNIRALRWLLSLLLLAWGLALGVALVEPAQLVQSPLANDSVWPDGWLGTFVDKSVWSFLYAVDIVVSPISLGQAETIWPEASWLSLVFAVIKGLSLVLLGLFLTGVTGLAERKSS